ncbi:Aste57867_1933 [Aphanomyces stellatus]|uniref:Aste57867_1933 protein n=1 Tax=Aphanomyces stellatus TaxID=120398 RepID=A0A485KAN4_9STRA|nr:hypothetical protein As57867_001931 [Aphanomyces stellatus]VFT79138.1 Aste57867_1933 [Aphanomyces stellatus]
MTKSALQVLLSEVLLGLVVDYQDGLYMDMRPLLKLRLRINWWSYDDQDIDAVFPSSMALLHAELDPWHDAFYITHRLRLLLHSPHCRTLRLIVAMEAAFFGRLSVLQDMALGDDLVGLTCPLLDIAAFGGHMDVLRFLHDCGHGGCSVKAMDWAAMHGDIAIVAFLGAHRTEGCSDHALHYAAIAGNIPLATLLRQFHGSLSWLPGTPVDVIRRGHMEMALWMDDREATWSTQCMDMAAFHGHLELLEWLHTNPRSAGCTTSAMNLAARAGHVQVLEWLHVHRTEGCTVNAMDWAASQGHRPVLEWLHVHRTEGCSTAAVALAFDHGHHEIAAWLWDHRIEVRRPTAAVRAAAKGNVALLAWLHAHQQQSNDTMKWQPNVMDAAAAAGQLDVVKWLHVYRSEGCSTRAMDDAAAGGHLAMVQWLHEHRHEGCTSRALDDALAAGHWSVVDWLHLHRTEGYSSEAIRRAMADGVMPALTWLHHVGQIGWSTEVLDRAMRHDDLSLETLQWLHCHRPEFAAAAALEVAVRRPKSAILAWLHEACPTDRCRPAFFRAMAECGNTRAMQWLKDHQPHDEGWTSTLMDVAARAGELEMVQWLHSHRSEGCTVDAVDDAAMKGHGQIVAFLLDHRSEGWSERGAREAMIRGYVDIVRRMHEKQRDVMAAWFEDAIMAEANGWQVHWRVRDWWCEELAKQ